MTDFINYLQGVNYVSLTLIILVSYVLSRGLKSGVIIKVICFMLLVQFALMTVFNSRVDLIERAGFLIGLLFAFAPKHRYSNSFEKYNPFTRIGRYFSERSEAITTRRMSEAQERRQAKELLEVQRKESEWHKRERAKLKAEKERTKQAEIRLKEKMEALAHARPPKSEALDKIIDKINSL